MVAAAALALFASAACSLDRFEHDVCSSDDECRADFGFGAVCGSRGLCQRVSLPPRCGPSYPEDLFDDQPRYRQAVVLGSLMDLSSEAHLTRSKAVRLAVKAANLAGGIDGRPFGLVECDIRQDDSLDGDDRTQAAVSSAAFLVDRLGVPAMVGPSASVDVAAVWQAVHGKGALVMSPAATSPTLSALEPDVSAERPALLWRTAPSDALQGKLIADDMIARGVSRVVVLRESGPYGEALAALFVGHFTAGNSNAGSSRREVEMVSLLVEGHIDGAVAAVPSEAEGRPPAEVLFISSQQSWVVRFLQQAAAAHGFANRRVFLTDAAANQAVLTAATGAAALFPRVRGTRPAPRDPSDRVFASFVADYRAEYQGESPTSAAFSAHAYDAAWLTLYGAAWSLVRETAVTGSGIARGLGRLRSGPSMPLLMGSFGPIVSALRADRPVDLSGASGELDFDPGTREIDAPLQIWTIATSTGGSPGIVAAGEMK